MRHGGQRQLGASLIELVLSMVVLGLCLSALVSALSWFARHSADSGWQGRAVQLGQSYLDDALALRFQEDSPTGGGAVASCVVAGPEADESGRIDFDDVDDYHGLSESGRFLDDAGVDDYGQYLVAVQVHCVGADGQGSSHSKHVLIHIQGPGQRQLRLAGFRGNF